MALVLSSESITKSCWVDESTGKKGTILYPRELSIISGSDPTNWSWHWLLLESHGHKVVEVPKLIMANHLEISGEIEMADLDKCKYEVTFMAMLKDPTEDWNTPVTLTLQLPNKTAESHAVPLDKVPKNQWVVLVVGEFQATGSAGVVKFSISDTTEHSSKSGLIVKCAVIHPVLA